MKILLKKGVAFSLKHVHGFEDMRLDKKIKIKIKRYNGKKDHCWSIQSDFSTLHWTVVLPHKVSSWYDQFKLPLNNLKISICGFHTKCIRYISVIHYLYYETVWRTHFLFILSYPSPSFEVWAEIKHWIWMMRGRVIVLRLRFPLWCYFWDLIIKIWCLA